MDPLMLDCTTVEQRPVARFLWEDGVKPVEIHRRTLASYGSKNNMTQREVHEWTERFKAGKVNVADEARSSPAINIAHTSPHLRNAILIRED